MRLLSIITPVYNNSESLKILYKELNEIKIKLSRLGTGIEWVLIDDGSQDSSWEVITEISRKAKYIKAFRLTRNFGSVPASQVGLERSSGNAFIFLAADLQDPPDLIMELHKHWRLGEEFVLYERTSRKDPIISKIFSRFFYSLIRFFVMRDFPKGGFDYFLLDSRFRSILLTSDKFSYTSISLWWLGIKPKILPYTRLRRPHGKSQWSLQKRFRAAVDILTGFTSKPVRIMSIASFVVSSLCFTYGVFVLFSTISQGPEVRGWASLVLLITVLFGLLFLLLAIVVEYLWRILAQLNGRPKAVIMEQLP